MTLCVPCILLQCVNDQRDAQFLTHFLFHGFLLYMFRRITRSSSGALHNILYYTVVQSVQSYCVIQYIMQCSWWWTSNSFETCRAKNRGIKRLYKNCASRWSSTNYMTHTISRILYHISSYTFKNSFNNFLRIICSVLILLLIITISNM